MVTNGIWGLIAAGGLTLVALGQNVPRVAPIPADPLELATGSMQVVNSPADRDAVLQLLTRARNNYGLQAAGLGYDLKVTFTVNSGGLTDYDGAWQMEDVSDPKQGLRWTAKAATGFKTARITSNGIFYGEATANTIPLRLQEARAALFDPIPSSTYVEHQFIRTSASSYNGVQVTCVLLSNSRTGTPGRSWEETEECIEPQTGLLQVHSQVPGRYYAYDYSNSVQLGGHMLPHKVIVTEAGKTVSEIAVDSLKELPSADASLFAPTDGMKAGGPPIAMIGTQKLSRFEGPGPFTSGVMVRPVCVFGLVTPSGQLVEAHSLQPSDPNSAAAVEAAKKINFASPTRPGTRPQQHFVFVIEKFVASQ